MQHIFQYVPGINRLGGEDEHPRISSAEDKKKLSSKSTSSVCEQDKFILHFIYDKKKHFKRSTDGRQDIRDLGYTVW